MRGASRIVAVVLGGAIGVAACAGPSPSPSPVPASATDEPASPAASPSPPSSTTGAVGVDSTLLDVLPAAVAGLDRAADATTAAELAASPDIGDSIEALALAVYAGPGPSSDVEDLAIVSVARVLDGVADDAWFRAWRDSYDAAACEPAGGVAGGSAQAEIDGRTVYIGTCQAGAHTYHVRLTDPDRVVAVTAIGDDRIGEQVMAGLTE
jgi:hypothetical protein